MEHRKSGAKTIFFIILVLLGIAGNRWNVTLFFGVDFLFGSIASFILLATLGTGPALLSSALIGGYTYFLWNHPFAMLTYMGQIAFVGLFLKRARSNLTLATGAFWLILGVPISFFIFDRIFKTSVDTALIVALKQAINEIFNSVIASLILEHSFLSRLRFLQLSQRRSVFQTIFNVFVAAAIIPAFLILVLDARKSVEQIEKLNKLRLDTLSKSISFFSANDAFQQLLNSIHPNNPYYATLLNQHNEVLNSNRPGISRNTKPIDLEEDPQVKIVPPHFFYRWPDTPKLNPFMVWGRSSFGIVTPVPDKDGWSLQIEIPLADQEQNVFHQYVRAMTLLLVLVLVILLASHWFATLIGAPLARLSSQTTHLPEQLTNRGMNFLLPQTNFIEIEALIKNFKEMDEELRRRFTELERANRMKDEFLATLSHELRTPLNVILGHASLLKQEIGESEDHKIPNLESSLDAIARNAAIQNQLVSDLLDISAIITGKVSFHPRIISLTELGHSVAESVQLSAEAKGVRLRLELTECPCTVLGDSTRLHQVIWNLLSNAIKFTQRGGEIVLNIYSEMNDGEKYCIIQVDDDGRGIEPDFIPHIFERFRQEDSTTTRKFGGLGLGLSIVRHLVELHGGTVSASSEGKGKGAHFRIKLPFAENTQFAATELDAHEVRPSTEDARSPARQIHLKGLHLLVVDDDADSRELMSFVLQRAGATVETAINAGQALELLKRNKYHLMVSDIGLPDEDGYTLIRKLRKDDSSVSRLTPAIALTAYAREEDRRKSLESGFQAYLSKPVDVDQLILLIREWNPT